MFLIIYSCTNTVFSLLFAALVADLGGLTISPKPTATNTKSTSKPKANNVNKDGDPSPA